MGNHYLIDGYNLLFKLKQIKGTLELRRSELLIQLNRSISARNLSVTIVFDAQYVDPGESIRTHFDKLEIVYTAKGQTADEYILQQLYNLHRCDHETVVTSDLELGKRAHLLGAKVELISTFLEYLFKEKGKKKGFDKGLLRENSREMERLKKIFEERLKENQ